MVFVHPRDMGALQPRPECYVPVPGIPRTRIFLLFWWYRNRFAKNGTRKKSWNRYRKNLVPEKVSEPVSEKLGTEKSTGIGIEKIWYRKKVLVSVSFNILGTVTLC